MTMASTQWHGSEINVPRDYFFIEKMAEIGSNEDALWHSGVNMSLEKI
jgi:hypothetical protein